jgi:transcriptional antiterminator RfaH
MERSYQGSRRAAVQGLPFIQIEDKMRDDVFNYPGAVRYFFWLHRPALVRSCEINGIKK